MRKIRSWAAIACVALIVTCSPVRADFSTAMKIYQEEHFEEALVAFEALAAVGDRSSLFNLGVMHYRGEAVEPNLLHGYALMYLANKDHDFAGPAATLSRVHESFNDVQRLQALQMIERLSPVYDMEIVQAKVLPVLLDDKDNTLELLPEKMVAPRYPRIEQRRGRSGATLTEYTVSPQGYVRDVYIGRPTSKPFSKASAAAAKQFRYAPPADGSPIYGITNRFTYELETSWAKTSKAKAQRLLTRLDAALAAAESGDAIAQFRYGLSLSDLHGLAESLEGVEVEHRDANLWYQKSAQAGLPHAQFELGKNMMSGLGCEIDRESGLKWIKAAAVSGHTSAQYLLAREVAGKERTDQTNLAIMSWLRKAALADYYPAKIHLAWELSTSASEHLRDAKEALQLLEDESDQYFDEVRVLETQAAAYARLGKHKKAVKLQKKALSIAEDLDWVIPDMQDRLGLYQHSEAWVGSYY